MSCYGDTECSLCKDETECNLEMRMRCARLGVCMYYRPKLVSDITPEGNDSTKGRFFHKI